MNDTERKVMMEMHMKLTECLDPLYIRDILLHTGGISRETALAVSNEKIRSKRTEDFLFKFVEECPMDIFLNALKYNKTYDFLAKDISDTLNKLENRRSAKNEADNASNVVSADTIPPTPNKINVFTTQRNKAMTFKHKIKRLSHEGDCQKVLQITQIVYNRWINQKRGTREGTKLADLAFMAVDSEVESRRVKYDCSLYNDSVFDKMLKLIPFTSEPKVSSMTYLARYGSAMTMKEALDNGIAYLNYAREHSTGIIPCYESGIVLYIEHNLLVQKYQLEPNQKIKEKLIKLAETAIFHFGEEEDSMRIDYKRMLLLKIAFIHLGIGLFGENMDVSIEENDLTSAKNCLDCVEKPDLWVGMEKRRKMFFHIAKSKYYQQQKVSDLAVFHAKRAKKLAEDGKFKKELMNIEQTIFTIYVPLKTDEKGDELDQVITEFLEEFPEND